MHGLVPDTVEERLRQKVSTRDDPSRAIAPRASQRRRTMKVTATVDRLRREGVEVIDFGAGEPDFGTPDFINAAAQQAIDQHFSKYTPVGGIAELKRAICARYQADYGVEYHESRGHHQRRWQAGALQHRADALWTGRRGHPARAVLADAHRAGEARRSDAGRRADEGADDGFAITRSSDARCRHAHARAASSSTRRATRRER